MAAQPAYPQDPDGTTGPVRHGWASFAILPAQLARDPNRKLRAAKLVLLALASYANAERSAWPSVARLAADTGLDRATVQRALAEAEAAGYLHRQLPPEKAPGPTTYTLLGGRTSAAPPPQQRGPGGPHQRGPKQYQGDQYQLTGPPAPNGAGPQGLADNRLAVRQVFDAWVASLPPGRARQLTEPRRKAIRARLREGYSVADLCAAAQGWLADPWPERPQHNDLAVLLRSGGSVEKFAALHRDGPAPTVHQAMLAGHGTDVLRPRNRFLPNP